MSEPTPDGREPLILVHHHPGRLRVRSAAFREPLRGAPEGERLARARLAAERCPGIARVAADPFTGSVLVEYRPGEVEPGAVVAAMADAAGLKQARDLGGPSPAEPIAGRIIAEARKLDGFIREASSGRADLGTMVPAALVASATFLFARRPDAPRWDNLIYWGYSIFRDLNRDVRSVVDAVAAPRGDTQSK